MEDKEKLKESKFQKSIIKDFEEYKKFYESKKSNPEFLSLFLTSIREIIKEKYNF